MNKIDKFFYNLVFLVEYNVNIKTKIIHALHLKNLFLVCSFSILIFILDYFLKINLFSNKLILDTIEAFIILLIYFFTQLLFLNIVFSYIRLNDLLNNKINIKEFTTKELKTKIKFQISILNIIKNDRESFFKVILNNIDVSSKQLSLYKEYLKEFDKSNHNEKFKYNSVFYKYDLNKVNLIHSAFLNNGYDFINMKEHLIDEINYKKLQDEKLYLLKLKDKLNKNKKLKKTNQKKIEHHITNT